MHRAALALAAFACASALVTAPAAASPERCVRLTLVRPHAPLSSSVQAHVLFDDVNRTRAQHGLAQLADDPQLDAIARDVAVQMATRGYFGHTDPGGVTFEERLRAAGFTYRYAAEKMAFDRDVASANAALLHSPGHYANIVDPEPHRLGTAVVTAGDGQVFFVEEFAD